MKTTSRIIVIALWVCGLVGTGSSADEITAARPLSRETSLLANGAAPACPYQKPHLHAEAHEVGVGSSV